MFKCHDGEGTPAMWHVCLPTAVACDVPVPLAKEQSLRLCQDTALGSEATVAEPGLDRGDVGETSRTRNENLRDPHGEVTASTCTTQAHTPAAKRNYRMQAFARHRCFQLDT